MISVLLPVRNVEAYLEAAVDSVLNQTFRDFELVVVDDDSTDRTPEIIARYAAQDSRVRVIRTHRLGSAGAANLGLQHCRYPWVAIMHGDDVSLPTRLERQYAMTATDPDVVIWGTDGYHITPRGDMLSSFRVGPTSKEQCRKMRREGQIVQAIHPSVLINRKAAIDAGGYDETLSPVEDVDLFDRMLKLGDLVTIPEPLIKYRVHRESLSSTKAARMAVLVRFILARQRHRLAANEELTFEEFFAEDKNRPWIVRLREWVLFTSSIFYRRGGMYYGERQYLNAACCLFVAFALHPIGNTRRAWTQVLSARARRHIKSYRSSGQEV